MAVPLNEMLPRAQKRKAEGVLRQKDKTVSGLYNLYIQTSVNAPPFTCKPGKSTDQNLKVGQVSAEGSEVEWSNRSVCPFPCPPPPTWCSIPKSR